LLKKEMNMLEEGKEESSFLYEQKVKTKKKNNKEGGPD